MGRFLNESWLEGYEEAAVKRYLHDFVHTMLKPLVPDEEKVSDMQNFIGSFLTSSCFHELT